MSLLVFFVCVNDALSFYVTKTVLVGPKWFWSDKIDLDLTIMIWSQPNHYDQVQINLVRPKPFLTNQNYFGHIEGQGIRNREEKFKNILFLFHRSQNTYKS